MNDNLIDIKEEYTRYLTYCICSTQNDFVDMKILSFDEFKEKHLQKKKKDVKY